MIDLIKKAFYRLGLISAYHRVKNENVLTVIMLHRVLPTHDPRWSAADQGWAVSEELFKDSFAFFKQHYHFVSLSEVEESLRGRHRLPTRPLLLTFDDGWADNFDYVYPILKKENIPALIFVAAGAVDRKRPFWREAIVMALKAGYLSTEKCRALAEKADRHVARDVYSAVDLVAALSSSDEERREQWLEEAGVYDFLAAKYPPFMLNAAQLRELSANKIAIGVHGYTHNPISIEANWAKELQASRTEIQTHLQGLAPDSFSFPHGRYDGALIKKALETGYRLLFTSDPYLVPLVNGQITSPVLGRVHFAANDVTDQNGKFAPEKMAFWLFKRSAKNPSSGNCR